MKTAAEIITGLGGSHHSGLCRCPAHDDNTPSLSVRDVNGKVRLKCFAGCSYEQISAALRQRGLWGSSSVSRGFQQKENQPSESKLRESEDLHHSLLKAVLRSKETPSEYLKGRGLGLEPKNLKLLSESDCFRITGKRFPAMAAAILSQNGDVQGTHVTYLTRDKKQNCVGRDGKLRRMYGKSGYGAVPLAPTDERSPVVIGEGIETTLAAMELSGLPGVAALSAENLKVISPPPCASVIIAADNDNPGKEAASALAYKLSSQGYTVRIALPPEEGTDWNDALNGSADKEELRKSLLEAKPYEVKGDGGLALTMEQVMKLDVPPRHYLLKPWLRERSSGMIHAPRGAGKTWFAIAVAYAVASGRSLLDWEVVHRTRVLYVDAELDLLTIQERLKLLGEPTENLFFLSFDHLFQKGQLLPDLGRPEGREFFDRQFAKLKPGLVVLDSLTYLAKIPENEAECWDPIASWIMKHRRLGTTILFVHHQGRSGKARGTTKREDGIEVSISLKPMDNLADADGSAMELTFDKHREFFGSDAAPRIVKWSTNTGELIWETGEAPDSNKKRIIEMLKEGKRPTDIANELGVSKSYVSIVKKEMEEESLLA